MNISVKNINTINEIQGLNVNKKINGNQTNSIIAGSHEGCSKDTVVKFDFNKSGVYGEDKGEEFTMEELSDFLSTKPGAGSNMLYRMKPSEEFNTNAKEAIIKWREEKGLLADKDDSGIAGDFSIPKGPIHIDDRRGGIHHTFVTNSSTFRNDFTKEASSYSKYLTENKEPVNEKNDQMYRNIIKKSMKYNAAEILSYFKMGQETEEDVEALAEQLTDAALEFGRKMASGDKNISHIDTKLDINGVSMSYTQLLSVQQTLTKYNEQGLTDSFGDGGKYDYTALGTSYDVAGYEQLGTMAAKVKKDLAGFLPDNLAEMVNDVFKKRAENEIDGVRGEQRIESNRKILLEMAKSHARKVGNYSIIKDGLGIVEYAQKFVDSQQSYDFYSYKGTKFEAAFNAAYENEMKYGK